MKISKHAMTRMNSREVRLSALDYVKMNTAVFEASKKNIKKLLYVSDGLAIVLSVKNETMITVFKLSEGNIFTGIDGVIIK